MVAYMLKYHLVLMETIVKIGSLAK